jgi:hypothetical protein
MKSRNEVEKRTTVPGSNPFPIIMTMAGILSTLSMLAFFLIGLYFLQSILFFILFLFSLTLAWSAAIVARLVHEKRNRITAFIYVSAIFITLICVILGLFRVALGM